MTSQRAARNLVLATALSLLGFQPGEAPPRARTRAALARTCRELEALCAKEGTSYPARRIAADCARVLEDLAARFRGAAARLPSQSNRRKTA